MNHTNKITSAAAEKITKFPPGLHTLDVPRWYTAKTFMQAIHRKLPPYSPVRLADGLNGPVIVKKYR